MAELSSVDKFFVYVKIPSLLARGFTRPGQASSFYIAAAYAHSGFGKPKEVLMRHLDTG